MRLLSLAVALALTFVLLAPDRAGAEACACSEKSFSWLGCDADGCDPAGWEGCTPSADDEFHIEVGCSVRIEAHDDVLLDPPGDLNLQVRDGGSLEVQGPVELRVGERGLFAFAGSTVALRGCFRRLDGGCGAELEAASLFSIGTVLPCRDGVCDGDGDTVRLRWTERDTPADQWAAVGTLLSGLEVERDVLCFWQHGETDVGPDSGYCYRIAGLDDGDGERWLDFDVLQVWHARSDQAGYPLEARRVREVTLDAAYPAGSRVLRVRETDAVRGRSDQIGRWLRCSGSQRAYVVASVADDPGGDLLRLADARGIEEAEPEGATCHLDWGWSRGDVAFVMAPVHVTSSRRAANEGVVTLMGDVTLRGVVLDGLGGSPARGALHVQDANLREFRHVWLMDPLTSDGHGVSLENVQCSASVEHLTVTGGPEDPAADRNYGLAWFGGRSCTYYVSHLYTRHRGDDNLVTESGGNFPTGTIMWRWIQGGPASTPGDSGQFFDFGTGNVTNVLGADGLCTACTSQDGSGSLIIPSGRGSGLMGRLLWIGATGQGFTADAEDAANPRFAYRNVGVIGSAVDPDAIGVGQMVGLDTEMFYVRDVEDPRARSLRMCSADPFGALTRRLVRGVFLDVALGGPPCQLTGDAVLQEVVFVDPVRTGESGPLIQVEAGARAVVLERLTTAFRAAPSGIRRALSFAGEIAPGAVSVDRLLLTGLAGGDAEGATDLRSPANASAVQWGGSSCFADVQEIDAPEVLAAWDAPPIALAEPGFEDLAKLLLAPAPGSAAAAAGCGAANAGFSTLDWAHRKMRLLPTAITPEDAPRCGLIGFEALPLAAYALRRRGRQRGAQTAGASASP